MAFKSTLNNSNDDLNKVTIVKSLPLIERWLVLCLAMLINTEHVLSWLRHTLALILRDNKNIRCKNSVPSSLDWSRHLINPLQMTLNHLSTPDLLVPTQISCLTYSQGGTSTRISVSCDCSLFEHALNPATEDHDKDFAADITGTEGDEFNL